MAVSGRLLWTGWLVRRGLPVDSTGFNKYRPHPLELAQSELGANTRIVAGNVKDNDSAKMAIGEQERRAGACQLQRACEAPAGCQNAGKTKSTKSEKALAMNSRIDSSETFACTANGVIAQPRYTA